MSEKATLSLSKSSYCGVVENEVNYKTIGEWLESRTEKADESSGMPTGVSHFITYFNHLVQEDVENSEYYKEWMGILAALCLENYFDYKVSYKTIDLGGEVLERSFLGFLKDAKQIWIENETKINIYQIDKKDAVVMLPGVGLCPIKNTNAETFKSIPWANWDSETGKWLWDDTKEYFSKYPGLYSIILSRIAAIVKLQGNERLNGDIGNKLIQFCEKQEKNLMKNLQGSETSLGNIFAPETLPNKADKIEFSKKLLGIVTAKNDEVILEINCDFEEQRISFLSPINPEILDECAGKLVFSIHKTSSGKLDWVEVCVETKMDKHLYKQSKKYYPEEIEYTLNFPGITLFPYVNIPDWKIYYINITENLDGEKHLSEKIVNFKGEKRTVRDCTSEEGGITEITVNKGIGVENISDGRSEGKVEWWQVARLEERPSHVKVKFGEDFYGYLIIKYPQESENSGNMNSKAMIAGDFGTTSSVFKIKYAEASESMCVNPAEFEKYAKQLTPLLGQHDFVQEFAFTLKSKEEERLQSYKIPTKVGLFGYENGESKLFIKGKILTLKKASSKNLLQNTKALSIKSNIKFSYSKSNKMARSIFFDHIIFCCFLQARLKGAEEVSLRFSYPEESVKGEISKQWENVLKAYEEMTGLRINKPLYLSETKAAMSSIEGEINDGGVTVIADIGGGTMDLSSFICHPREENEKASREVIMMDSIRFAGNRLIGETLMEKVKRTDFGKIWKKNGDMQNIINDYSKFKDNKKERDLDYINFMLENGDLNYEDLGMPFKASLLIRYSLAILIIANFVKETVSKIKKRVEEGSSSIKCDVNSIQVHLIGCGASSVKILEKIIINEEALKAYFEDIIKRYGEIGEEGTVTLEYRFTKEKEEIANGLLHYQDNQNEDLDGQNQGINLVGVETLNKKVYETLKLEKGVNCGEISEKVKTIWNEIKENSRTLLKEGSGDIAEENIRWIKAIEMNKKATEGRIGIEKTKMTQTPLNDNEENSLNPSAELSEIALIVAVIDRQLKDRKI